jgi:hypothetical protein
VHYLSSDFLKIDSLTIGIETIIILIFSAYFLYERMNDPSTIFIYNDYRFWIVLGFMIYLAGSFFIYLFADKIPHAQLQQYWLFTDIFSAIKNVLFSIGILMFAQQQPKNKHRVNPSTKPYLDVT